MLARTLLILSCLFVTSPLLAEFPCACHTGVTAEPIRALEIAMLEKKLYEQVSHPMRVRTLNAEIKLTEARIKSLKRRLDEYEPMDRFKNGRALFVTIEETKLDLLREELHLQELKARRTTENRFHRQQARLHALKVDQAQRVVANHRKAMALKLNDEG